MRILLGRETERDEPTRFWLEQPSDNTVTVKAQHGTQSPQTLAIIDKTGQVLLKRICEQDLCKAFGLERYATLDPIIEPESVVPATPPAHVLSFDMQRWFNIGFTFKIGDIGYVKEENSDRFTVCNLDGTKQEMIADGRLSATTAFARALLQLIDMGFEG